MTPPASARPSPRQLDAAETAAALQRGEFTALELLEDCLGALSRENPALGAWTFVDAAGARNFERAAWLQDTERLVGLGGTIRNLAAALQRALDGCRSGSVVQLAARPPATLAMQAMTVDAIAGGRVWEVPWPVADEELLAKDVITLVVQVNGKVRGKITVIRDAPAAAIETAALADEKVLAFLDGATPKKVIVVPGKLVNLVV